MSAGGRYDRRAFLAGATGAAMWAAGALATSAAASSCGTGAPNSRGSAATRGIGTGSPRRGGTVTVGMNSEIDGFLPSTNHFDNTGLTYARTVFDSLTAVAADGSARPYLAQSVTPNGDMTRWTITLRPGVTFHDGSALTADVVVANLEALRQSPLTAQAVSPVTGVQAIGSLEVEVSADEPLVAFPHYLATQLGFVVARSQLDNPHGSQQPVGTGPFRYVSWEPNDHFTVARNQSYWRSGIPYLDGITFKPIVEDTAREASLRSGTIDVMVSHDPNAIASLRDDAAFAQVDDLSHVAGQPDVDFIVLNTTAAPLDDPTVRLALAHATDAQQLVRLFGAGVTPATSSLFPNGSPYRPQDNGYPTYDLAAARRLVAQAAPRHGGAIRLTLGDISDPRQLEIIQALQNMWGRAGIGVSLSQLQQVTYIDNLVTGQFQAAADEMFSASDPDLNYVWLSDTTASGPIALNWARNRNPEIEAALLRGRTSADPQVRVEAYQTVDKLLARDLPYLWISRAPWSLTASAKVSNVAGPTLPDGGRAEGFRAGIFTPAEMWRQA